MSPKLRCAIAASVCISLTVFAAASRAQPDSDTTMAPLPAMSGSQVKPMLAELMPRASQGLMLDVVNTGKHLVAIGERGNILVSNDGARWAQVAVPVQAALTALTFVDARRGWAVGHDATILNTTDAGKTWFMQNFEPEKATAFLDVAFVDAQRGYAVGAFGLFYATRDGGASWADVAAPEVRDAELSFHAITRLADGSLLLAGETGMLGVSSDGVKWERLKSPYQGSFFGVLPYGAEGGAIAFGLQGNVFVTDDVRSERWEKIETGTASSFYGGELLADGRALLVGSAGAMLVVDPVKARSELLNSGVTSSLTAVADFKGGRLVSGEEGVKLLAR